MTKMIQIRNVPEALHRRLRARAAAQGRSLSDYLLAEIRKVAEKPSKEEMIARLREMEPIEPRVSPADAVREEREAR